MIRDIGKAMIEKAGKIVQSREMWMKDGGKSSSERGQQQGGSFEEENKENFELMEEKCKAINGIVRMIDEFQVPRVIIKKK